MITASATKNFSMNSSTASRDVDRLIGDLGEGDARGSVPAILLVFRIQRPAQVQAVPAVLHDDAQHERGLAVVADQEGRRVLVAASDIRDVATA